MIVDLKKVKLLILSDTWNNVTILEVEIVVRPVHVAGDHGSELTSVLRWEDCINNYHLYFNGITCYLQNSNIRLHSLCHYLFFKSSSLNSILKRSICWPAERNHDSWRQSSALRSCTQSWSRAGDRRAPWSRR